MAKQKTAKASPKAKRKAAKASTSKKKARQTASKAAGKKAKAAGATKQKNAKASQAEAERPDLSRSPALNGLVGIGESIKEAVDRGRRPHINVPIRSLSNVGFAPRKGFFTLGDKKSKRTLSYQTVKPFAQTVRLMAFAKYLIQSNDFASKREVYYTSKGSGQRDNAPGQAGWGPASFQDQSESDALMDDVEAMCAVNREQLGFIPAEQNGSVAGELIVIDTDPATGRRIEIDCRQFGRGSYSIPSRVEGLEFRTKAKFVLAVETAALFERLNGHGYWREADCIVVAMGGVPTRANRRFTRILADTCKLPVYVFTDGDPYGYCNIYRTLKVGSGNAAHVNEFFCVPHARLLGVTPQDIRTYDLPTHPLGDRDRKRAQAGITNDPCSSTPRPCVAALETMLRRGVRVERKAFAPRGLNDVMETSLPEELRTPNAMLP